MFGLDLILQLTIYALCAVLFYVYIQQRKQIRQLIDSYHDLKSENNRLRHAVFVSGLDVERNELAPHHSEPSVTAKSMEK